MESLEDVVRLCVKNFCCMSCKLFTAVATGGSVVQYWISCCLHWVHTGIRSWVFFEVMSDGADVMTLTGQFLPLAHRHWAPCHIYSHNACVRAELPNKDVCFCSGRRRENLKDRSRWWRHSVLCGWRSTLFVSMVTAIECTKSVRACTFPVRVWFGLLV